MRIVNRRARFKYEIIERVEAGIVLTGAEIKSIRAGRADLSEAFARIRGEEVFLANAFIAPWMGSVPDSQARRERKLLLHKKQILNWEGKMAGGKFALVPTAIYIKGNLAKVDLALSKNKSKFDKRAKLKKRAIQRDVEIEVKEKGY